MPVELSRDRDGSLAVVRCSGYLTLDDITATVVHAFGTRQIEPGMDRIVIFDPRAQLHELDLSALQIIQGLVMEQEKRGAADVRFRSVLVATAAEHRGILKLYKALWDIMNMPNIEFRIADSQKSAFEILGVAPSG